LVDDATYSSFAPSFLRVQAQNTRLTRDGAVAEAEQWQLRAVIFGFVMTMRKNTGFELLSLGIQAFSTIL
jgi:hypothetical protein